VEPIDSFMEITIHPLSSMDTHTQTFTRQLTDKENSTAFHPDSDLSFREGLDLCSLRSVNQPFVLLKQLQKKR